MSRANGTPLPVKGSTRPTCSAWDQAKYHMMFLLLEGLEEVPEILGLDILRALAVQIDAAASTAHPT